MEGRLFSKSPDSSIPPVHVSYVHDILWEIIDKPLSEVSDDIDITQEELDKVKVVTIKQMFTLIDENEVRHEPVEIIEYSAIVED